jgi:hypothetical protein
MGSAASHRVPEVQEPQEVSVQRLAVVSARPSLTSRGLIGTESCSQHQSSPLLTFVVLACPRQTVLLVVVQPTPCLRLYLLCRYYSAPGFQVQEGRVLRAGLVAFPCRELVVHLQSVGRWVRLTLFLFVARSGR